MNPDRTEALIREALTEEADRAVDPGVVLARLSHGPRAPRRYRAPVIATAAAVVVVAAAGIVVPQLLDRQDAAPAAPAASAAKDQNVLVMGLDSGPGSPRADSIVLAHLGQDGSGSAVSIPRDSWVDVPGHGKQRLNGVYTQVREDEIAKGKSPADADDAAARAVATTVQNLTGVAADHYATVDMAAFAEISTAAGGVPVCLNQAVHDPLTGISFPVGQQTVSGDKALQFVRQRHGLANGDLDRIVRLQAFLRSLANKVLTAPESTREQTLTALLTTARDKVRTDQGWNLLDLAGQLLKLRPDALRLGTVPVTDPPANAGPAIGVDPAKVRSFVQDQFGSGTAPAPGGATCVN
ncbi:LCP family protein [Amycolatopsis sp. CA-230715]|uniref:LCP family protein n=1 Tax=Amycolatopsis sp. CA-230715 TaxID=2745196 RepID=UPI001C01937C|nr:LCP family protein [Amycolatopsis sp. CA-230715]QWF82135.1 Transcriptional regulator LytR [Amycolatopsis sp. CA-230715]